MKSLFLALALVFAAPNLAPAPAAVQGQGVGTLPAWNRTVPWLTAHQAIDAQRGEVWLHIGSTHDAEEEMQGQSPPSEPQTISTPWTSNGIEFVLRTPRWSSETGTAGEERWLERHRHALEAAMRKFPRDA